MGNSSLVLFLGLVSSLAFAEASPRFSDSSPFSLNDHQEERSDRVVPLVSVFLPGFGQWRENQNEYGLLYSGGAVGGLLYGAHFSRKVDAKYDADREGRLPKRDDPANKDPDLRRAQLGSQLYFTMGGLSAYHSFRSAARSAKGGRYDFLRHEETPADLALAPFNFSYLRRPTTYVPLLVGAGLLFSALAAKPSELAKDGKKRSYSVQDTAFALPLSYNAGLGEEALFRGWTMPLLYADTGHPELANGITALIFGLGHLSSSNRNPLFQVLAGYYLGYVTQQDDWRLGESIFIHAWWDLFVISAAYAVSPLDNDQASPIIWLPPLQLSF